MTIGDLIARQSALEKRIEVLETRDGPPIMAHYSTDTGTITNDTATIVNYDTKIYDTWDAVTTGASWVFTVPISGFYLVTAIVGFEGSPFWGVGDEVWLDVFLEGVHYARLDDRNDVPNSPGVEVYVGRSAVVEATKGDEINLVVYQNSGQTQTIDTSEHSYVWIAQLG